MTTNDELNAAAREKRPPMSAEQKAEIRASAYNNATNGTSQRNVPTIYRWFTDRGIPEADIRPRENVFTRRAWEYRGRRVLDAEARNGAPCTTVRPIREWDKEAGKYVVVRSVTSTVPVFHVSQTEPM